MRRKASELDCGYVFRILYDAFLCREQTYVEAYISNVIVDTGMASTHVETNMTDEGYGGQSRSCS